MFEPIFDSDCRECGRSPIVGVREDEEAFLRASGLCGPCYFGDRMMVDWEIWNDQQQASE